MATIAELKIIVDSSQVEKAKKDLASLGEAATKVGASTKGFSDGMKNATDSSEEFSGAAQRLIARAKEMEATVGASKGGLLNYKASILGVADVVKPLATSLDTLTIAQKNQDAVTKEVARNQAVADTAKYKMIEALKEEIALYGKSKNEIALYRAEQLGIIDSVRPLVEELNRLKDAREGADKAGKSGADERISKKQQELEALKLEGAELQKNSALIGEKANAEARIAEQQKAVEANRVKYESKQQEIAELKGVAEGERLLAEEKKKVTKATEAERDAFVKLQHEIDPLSKSMDNYERQLSEIARLREHASKGRAGFGKHDLKDLDALEAGVNNNIKRMKDLGSTSGKTAKEIAFSMRGLPAQFTDIAVSLQGGQKPLTVMLQQGGQLKDMFGGIVPAFKAMGGYVLGLINPFTVLAATIGSLGIAIYAGSRDIDKLNTSIITSGKLATVSSSELLGYARATSEITGTVGAAIGVVSAFSAETKLTEDNIIKASVATLAWSRATGTAVEDITKDFISLGKDPVNAVVELDKKYKFLTTTLYENIRSLQEAGRTMEATKVATEALAASVENKSIIMVASLGTLETAWYNIKGAVSGVIDKMKELGRTEREALLPKFQKERTEALEEFNKVKQREAEGYVVGVHGVRQAQEAYEKADRALKALTDEMEISANQPFVEGIKAHAAAYEKVRSEVNKAETELASYRETTKLAREAGKLSADSEAESLKYIASLERKIFDGKKRMSGDFLINEAKDRLELTKEEVGAVVKMGTAQKDLVRFKQEIADIEQQILDTGELSLSQDERSKINRKGELLAIYTERAELEKNHTIQKKAAAQAKKNSVVRDDAATKLLLSLSQQEASLREQLVTDSKLGQQSQEFAKMDAMFADLKEKEVSGRLTLEQQSLLNSEAEIRAQRTILVDLEAQNRAKADGVKIDAYRENLANKLKSDKDKSVDFTATRGVSDKEAGRLKEINELSRERNELDRDSARLLAETGNTDVYDKQIKANAEYYKERKKNLKEYYELEDEAQQDWQGGMQAGFANFIESQADMYASMSELTQNTLSTLADGVSESLTQAILYGEDLRTSLSNLAMTITEQLLKGLIDVGIQFAINAAKEAAAVTAVGAAKQAAIVTTATVANTATVATTATQTAAGASTAAAWSPAALAASIGSFGTAAAIGLAAVVATMAAFGGFRKGGYTGNMGVDDVAGVVHGKEYVFDAAATSRIGINNLESLRSGGGISSDFTSSGSSSGGGRSGGTVNQTINVQGTVDRQTANQIARRSAQKQSIAEARLG